jgi:hypothetical protein
VEPAQDLLYDILWFFESQSWQPALGPIMGSTVDRAVVRLPCVATYLSSKEAATNDVVAWQKRLRMALTKGGFYKDKYSKRPDEYLARQVTKLVAHLVDPKGSAAHVLIYTDPKVPLARCSKEDNYTQARCAYANHARALKAKTPHAVLIPADSARDGLDHVWAKVLKATKGRAIVALEFFDHGAPGQQTIGNDVLTSDSEIPAELGARIRKGAIIRLHGCFVVDPQGHNHTKAVSILAEHLAYRLLLRGGKVIGSKTSVSLDPKKWRIAHEEKFEFEFSGCSARKELETIINLVDEVCSDHKVKYSFKTERREAPALVMKEADLASFPDLYPNVGYYTNG